jgi:hypothetical protein
MIRSEDSDSHQKVYTGFCGTISENVLVFFQRKERCRHKEEYDIKKKQKNDYPLCYTKSFHKINNKGNDDSWA